MTEWENLYFNKKIEDQQRQINAAHIQNEEQKQTIAVLEEQVRQRDRAIQQIQGSLMFRIMVKLRAIGTRLGMRRLLMLLRQIKHGGVSAETPKPQREPVVEPEFDYVHMLSTDEYRFLEFKERRLSLYAVALPDINTPCVQDLVSVILPVYNGEDLLALSIESVLAQTYRNFEFIIVDDGSTDGTPSIVDTYAAKDPRVRVVHQKNQKLPKTLSNGFAMARGEFFTWTSADNVMHPDFLEKLVSEMKAHPQTGMVYADLRLIDEKGVPLTEMLWYPDPMDHSIVHLPQCVLRLNTFADNYVGAAFMYRASVAHAIGNYSPNRYTTEDYDYWMRINECFELRHVGFNDPIYDYRIHSDSLTAKDKELKITANRYRLMLWDDFRRSYLLRPLVWSFSGVDPANAAHRALMRVVEKAGHTIITDEAQRALLCESDYTSTVHIAFDAADPSLLPENCYKVRVCEAPQEGSAQWDCLVSLTPVSEKDFIEGHKGWFSFASIPAMFGFLDIRAKSEFLGRMETAVETPDTRVKKLSVVMTYQGNMNRLYQALLSLTEQNVPQGEYEIIVVGTQSCAQEVQTLFGRLRQKKELDRELLRFAVSTDMTQTDGANIGLWASRGKYISFADAGALYPMDYVQNVLFAFQIYPRAAAVCGKACPCGAFETLEEAAFDIVKSIDEYMPEGCVSFAVGDLMMLGGFTAAVDMPGAAVPSGWELEAMAQLLKNDYLVVMADTVRYSLQGQHILEQQAVDARLENQFALQTEGLVPFSFWLPSLETAKEQAERKLKDMMAAGQDAIGQLYVARAYETLIPKVQDYFLRRTNSEPARTLYTRHWVDADGSMKNIQPLEWLAKNMKNVPMPWVSVIVPIYKVEQYLERCVVSLRMQTVAQIEILLVDDGSPDHCPEMCDRYAAEDERIRVIHKVNGGLSDARNAGVDVAKGEYLSFVDSDDWVEPDMIEQLLFAARICDAQIAEGSFDNVYKKRTEPETQGTGMWTTGSRTDALNGQIEWRNFKCVAWNKLYHKSIFADGKRYPVGKYHEDEFFTHRAFYDAARLVFVDRILYHYDRTREDSITGVVFNEKGLDVIEAMRQRCSFFKEKKEDALYQKMLDLYCWTALDRLSKCRQNHIEGDCVEKVRSWLREDWPELERAGMSEERRRQLLKELRCEQI